MHYIADLQCHTGKGPRSSQSLEKEQRISPSKNHNNNNFALFGMMILAPNTLGPCPACTTVDIPVWEHGHPSPMSPLQVLIFDGHGQFHLQWSHYAHRPPPIPSPPKCIVITSLAHYGSKLGGNLRGWTDRRSLCPWE